MSDRPITLTEAVSTAGVVLRNHATRQGDQRYRDVAIALEREVAALKPTPTAPLRVCYSDQAMQPHVHILCMGDAGWTTPGWDRPHGTRPFQASNGRYYSFEPDPVSCPDCATLLHEKADAAAARVRALAPALRDYIAVTMPSWALMHHLVPAAAVYAPPDERLPLAAVDAALARCIDEARASYRLGGVGRGEVAPLAVTYVPGTFTVSFNLTR